MCRTRKSLLLAATLAALGLLSAASAHADTFCLNSPTCGGSNNYEMTRDGLAAALLAAQNTPEPSTIEIGSGTITIDSPIGVAASASNSVSIEGVGATGRPLLDLTYTASGPGFTFTGSGSSPGGIAYVDVKLEPAAASRTAFDVTDGRIFDVNFDVQAQNGFGSTGLALASGAECVFCDFTLSGSSSYGVVVSSSTGTIKRSTFINGDGAANSEGVISFGSSTVNIFTSQFSGLSRGARVSAGTVNLTDSVIDLGSLSQATGVDVDNPSPTGSGNRAANLDGVTIVGSGTAQTGLRVAAETTNVATENATGIAKNSLFLLTGGSSVDLYCLQGANATSQLNATYSLIRSTSPVLSGACSEFDSNNIQSDSVQPSQLFVDAAAGNFRLRKTAAVIDHGIASNDPSLVGRAVDAYSHQRVIGSNVDMGGSEYENLAPLKPILTPSTTAASVGAAVQLSALSTDPNGDALTYDWNFGDGSVGTGATTSHSFTQAGTFTVSVAASDFDLQGPAANVSITVTVPALPLPPPSSGVGETPLSFSFTKPKCKFKLDKKSKNGFKANSTAIKDCYLKSFSSAEHSYMFRLERTAAGYLVGGSCKAKQGKTGSAKRCNLPLKGSQLIALPAGTSYLSFGGVWNKKPLDPGTYTLKSGINGINPNGMPNRISMNLTVARQGSSGRTK